MGNGWRTLRRRILTPDVAETSLDRRGFHKKSPAATELLETVGAMFLAGYAHAVEAAGPADADERIRTIPTRFRGFAYEGAGMGLAMLDGLPLPGHRRVLDFVAGPGDPHIYLVYVGAGWAMARLPRFRWPKPERFDPLLRWLMLDGYGFHQAYFRTDRYIREQYRDPAFPWPGGPAGSYSNRAIDQGIGRALWFIGGTDVDVVTDIADGFAEDRRGDLYAGIGLAATYACGVTAEELRRLVRRAGPHRYRLAQGSAFAAEARRSAGFVMPETELATSVLTGLPVDEAARLTQDVRPTEIVDGWTPAFEQWRQRIADAVAERAGVRT